MKNKVIHPFLFAILPLCNVFAYHAGVVAFSEFLLAAGIMMVAGGIVWVIFYLISKNSSLSSILTSAVVIAMYSIEVPVYLKNISTIHLFGTDGLTFAFFILLITGIYLYFRKANYYKYIFYLSYLLLTMAFINNDSLFSAYLLILSGIVYSIYNLKIEKHINAYLNLISILLLASATFILFQNYMPFMQKPDVKAFEVQIDAASELPDIYYIILDGYARADVLNDIYGFDNSYFINYLEEKGFHVAAKSNSNYGQTVLSLSSALNASYHLENTTLERKLLASHKIKQNNTFYTLQKAGYKIIAQPTGYSYTELRKADIYSNSFLLGDLFNAFIGVSNWRDFMAPFKFQMHKNRVLANLANLPGITDGHSPAFVFSHMLAPHPPFVLGMEDSRIKTLRGFTLSDGNHFHFFQPHIQDIYKELFKQQTQVLNQMIMETIDGILAESSTPPVIILQSDHGPGCYLNHDSFELTDVRERYSILNAVYFPDQDYSLLYDEISKVNTFRVVFNKYFGSEKELLDDRIFWADFIKMEVKEIKPGIKGYSLLD